MKSPHSWERISGDTAWFMILTLLTLCAGGDRAVAQSHGLRTRQVQASFDGTAASGRLVKEIDDPNSGTRWLLVRDKANPGGPGRLERAPQGRDPETLERQVQGPSGVGNGPVSMIRAGDKLVVEEHSAAADAYLEGVALGPAGTGSALNVRLSIGGRVVRAVAVAHGRAALEAATGGRR
jgi:hypothetical protein